MKEYIEGFIEQLNQAYEVGVSSEFIVNKKKISSVLLCGLGGSGIGGVIVARFAQSIAKVPFSICNDYHIPAFVNKPATIKHSAGVVAVDKSDIKNEPEN